ncbi:MAG: hypothetical protein JWN34_4865 [Bryobacterales bacterium]|nr:hypothetical protein [Bryobacterales bacterium]
MPDGFSVADSPVVEPFAFDFGGEVFTEAERRGAEFAGQVGGDGDADGVEGTGLKFFLGESG